MTPAGHDLVERGARHVLTVDDALTAGLTDAELSQIESLLARWIEAIPGSNSDQSALPK
ncbi:hypothetical protein [Cellulomonas chengniuliangii]|nr:hypothetical protein [Cellulomonas chengniuliangii]